MLFDHIKYCQYRIHFYIYFHSMRMKDERGKRKKKTMITLMLKSAYHINLFNLGLLHIIFIILNAITCSIFDE
jgi:hypothetical protein